MIDAAYTAWRTDTLAGRASVLVTDSNESVLALNNRARADLILDGTVDARREVELHDRTRAAAGDAVITRRNDRRLRAGRGWVRNGDRWTITEVRDDGSLTPRRAGKKWCASVVLPAGYAAENLDAVTSYRAQGIMVDSSHVLADASMTRENFYVAMTRGSEANVVYVAVDKPDPSHPGDNEEATARSVLFGMRQHVGAELSAHETITVEQDAWGSIAQLAAKYETLLPRLVRARVFGDAADIAAVLHYRVTRATARPAGAGRARKSPKLIVGLIPAATGTMTAEMRRERTTDATSSRPAPTPFSTLRSPRAKAGRRHSPPRRRTPRSRRPG